jgi:hypothetical protein
MMRRAFAGWLRSAHQFTVFVTLFATVLASVLSASSANAAPLNQSAESVFALVEPNTLIQFQSNRPGLITRQRKITGLQPGETLLGIDFRPANGQLYGLGSTSRLYIIAPRSAVALPVGTAPFSPTLSGSSFGFDFNPTVDRIRVVSDTGQNFRLHPDTGAVVMTDGTLNYVDNDPNEGKTPGVNGSAYTNPDNNATTGTKLYALDAAQDVLAVQDPPNAGGLATVGSLGVDVESLVGFDISPSGVAYAGLLARDGIRGSVFVSINLDTGLISTIGRIGKRVVGLAIPTNIAPIAGQMVLGLNQANELVKFDAATPGTISSRVAVSGLQPGESLLGIDFRPANGQLYGLGSTSRLYTIDPASGAALPVGTAPFSPTLSGNSFGFDFNPTVDRIRVVSDTGQNLRLQPDTGAVVMADASLVYAPSDPNAGRAPGVNGSGYTNSDIDPLTGTTLYSLDAARDVLAIQAPPNDGVQNTVGLLGMDVEALVGFDIAPTGPAYAGLLAKDGISGSVFATINLGTGQISTIGPIGSGERIVGLALMAP